MHDNDALLRTPEAAKLLNVTQATLEDWRYRGGGPPIVRLARKAVRYRRGDLLAWIAARTEGGAA